MEQDLLQPQQFLASVVTVPVLADHSGFQQADLVIVVQCRTETPDIRANWLTVWVLLFAAFRMAPLSGLTRRQGQASWATRRNSTRAAP